jgi:hypothetical protein
VRRSARTHRNEGIDIVRATPDEIVERARRIRSEVQRFAIVDPPSRHQHRGGRTRHPPARNDMEADAAEARSLGLDSSCPRSRRNEASEGVSAAPLRSSPPTSVMNEGVPMRLGSLRSA